MDEPPKPLLSGLPLWVQAISLVGFPCLVALFYMARDVGYFPTQAEANAMMLSQIASQHVSQTQTLAEMVKINRAICLNIATNKEDRNRCF